MSDARGGAVPPPGAGAPATFEHFPDYATEVLVSSPRLFVSATRHPGYPVARFNGGRFGAVLEGRVYDAPETAIGAELLLLAGRLFGGEPCADALARLAARDGEFVVVLLDREAEAAVVVSDRHGRLPLYRSRRGTRDVLSRELEVAARAHGAPRLEREALAQFLCFGYPLGSTTLFAGVGRVEPASVIHLPAGTTARALAPHDFDDKAGPADAAALAEPIAVGLIAACRARAAGPGPVVLSLSGGLDSRMVGGALGLAGAAPRAVTHGAAGTAPSADVTTAERVAARLGLPWELVAVPPPTGADVARLLAMKGGANYLGMSRVVPYLDAVRRRFGPRAILFTGDLGDRLLGDRRPAARLRDVGDLAEYLLRREAVLAPEAAAAVTGLPRRALREAVVARLEAYPERSLAQKHVHFLFYERALRWVYEGEDRNRCWCWHATPFYAPAVFDVAARAPDEAKADDRLRAAVLRRLAPGAADVPNASGGARVGGPRAVWTRRVRRAGTSALFRTVGPTTERRLRRWLAPAHGYGSASPMLELIRAQLRGRGPVEEYLRPAAVEAVVAEAPTYEREQFSVLLTVTSLIDRLHGGPPVLADYRDVTL